MVRHTEVDGESYDVAKGDAGTTHLYPEGEDSPKCGAWYTKAPTPNNKQGALRRRDVDTDDVDPWHLCEDCFPDRHQAYPDNDHWYDVERSRDVWVVMCSGCDFEAFADNKGHAHSVGITHKRYPDRDDCGQLHLS